MQCSFHLLSRLLRAAREAETPGSNNYESIVNAICEDHVAAARQHIQSTDILQSLTEEIREECQDLATFLEATSVRKISSFYCIC